MTYRDYQSKLRVIDGGRSRRIEIAPDYYQLRRRLLAKAALLMFGLAALLAALILASCGRIEIAHWLPRDGSPIVLELEGVPAEVAEAAARIWEPAGIRFVVGGWSDRPVRVTLTDDVPPEHAGVFSAWPELHVRVRYADPALVAHELGHALGLEHVPQMPCAVMSPGACSDHLTDADIEEFARTQF